MQHRYTKDEHCALLAGQQNQKILTSPTWNRLKRSRSLRIGPSCGSALTFRSSCLFSNTPQWSNVPRRRIPPRNLRADTFFSEILFKREPHLSYQKSNWRSWFRLQCERSVDLAQRSLVIFMCRVWIMRLFFFLKSPAFSLSLSLFHFDFLPLSLSSSSSSSGFFPLTCTARDCCYYCDVSVAMLQSL